jgi:C-terminal peptidase prc
MPAAYAGILPEAYGEAVRLIQTLYLYPQQLDAGLLLTSGARGLAEQVHWLIVETEGDTVYLRHGDGSSIGSLSVASMETLPEALAAMEDLVVASGYDLQGVDVRLAILQGMTDGLDRYSAVLEGDRLDRFDQRLKGTLVGIGLNLRLQADGLVITELHPRGPAERAGLRLGDKIVRIDGVSTVNMPVREASRRIQGEAGIAVSVTYRRDGLDREVKVAREEIVVPNVEHRALTGGVGYIKITHFSQRTDENLRQALTALRDQGALERGVVIDLRHNTGGSMKDSAESADQFVQEGMLLRTAGPDGGRVRNLQSRMDAEALGDEPNVPVVILQDRRTASGSEIMAGALVQLGRGVLIGTPSFGKGTVQKVYPVDPQAKLKLTVARYLLAGGRGIEDAGLTPDLPVVEVSLDADGMRIRRYDDDDPGVPWEKALPVLVESEGWRGNRTPDDPRIELARRAAMGSQGPNRQPLLVALQTAAAVMRVEHEQAMADAMAARGLDWSISPPRGPAAPVLADVAVQFVPRRDPPDSVEVRVEVVNTGTQPLERTFVELDSPTFSAWRGVAVPLGKVAPGQTAMGSTLVRLRPGIRPREDEVVPLLHTASLPPIPQERVIARVDTGQLPRVGVSGRIVALEPGRARAEITVQNLGETRLVGIEASFVSPGDLDVELVTAAARVASIPAKGAARLDLELAVGPLAPNVLPLEIVVESDRYRDPLVSWPVRLGRDGKAVSLQAPVVRAEGLPMAAAAGPLPVRFVATDETRIAHVTLFVNGEKVAWASGGRPMVVLQSRITARSGENRITVEAVDEQGLTTRDSWFLRGEVPTSVDADD